MLAILMVAATTLEILEAIRETMGALAAAGSGCAGLRVAIMIDVP